MKDLTTAVLWDLDSTVADTRQRQHLSPRLPGNEKRTWVEYSLACEADAPIAASVALMRLLWPHHQQIAISGRNMAAFDHTIRWLDRHNVPLDRVILRADRDYTPNGKFKVREIGKLRAEGLDVVLFMEDWPEAGRYIQEHTGVPVFLVNPGYEDQCTCGYASDMAGH